MWDRTNLPNDVRDCYPKAIGLKGLDKFPFDEVPNLQIGACAKGM
jgi:hypothetical protein